MNTKTTQLLDMTPELYKKIEVPRHDEKKAPWGFQRKLSKKRATQAADSLAGGKTNCPPILLGQIGEKLVCVDGQHRLEAWKMRKFPLQAIVYTYGSMEEAAADFDVINATSAKVNLSHRLKVSPSAYAKKVRELAKRYGVGNKHVHYATLGVIGKDRYTAGLVKREDWEMVEYVLSSWIKDPRWKNPNLVYGTPGMLRVVGHMVKSAKNKEKMLTLLGGLNFYRSQQLGLICGTGSQAFVRMRTYVVNKLFREGVV